MANLSKSILEVKRKNGDSYVWQSITKDVEALGVGYRFRLGNGDISFWYDHWLDIGPICHCVPYVHIHDTQLKVKEVSMIPN